MNTFTSIFNALPAFEGVKRYSSQLLGFGDEVVDRYTRLSCTFPTLAS